MKLQLNHTIVFTKNMNAYNKGIRFIINQGGTRSSKTYSIMQLLLFLCLTQKDLRVSVVRKTLPALKASAMIDFYDIMNEWKQYNIKNHNKTEQRYTFNNGSSIEFIGIDKGQKVRGRKRDILYCNEANELTQDDFIQLNMRTNKAVFLDFNPSDNESWLYDLLKKDESCLIKSTYKDNIFLEESLVEQIEDLINVDENYYKVYVLGERPIATTRIYTHFKSYDFFEEFKDSCYGLDFGYNHPCALIESSFDGNKVYVREIIYRSKLTTADLITLMNELGVDKRKHIYCDSARPEVIEEIKRAGYRASGSDKAVKAGIDKVKSMEVFIHSESVNLWKEFKLYSWKSVNGVILDEPVKLNDDGMDAMRYSIHSHIKGNKFNSFYADLKWI